MGFRVALLGIYHESNTFIAGTTTCDDFRNGHWLWGDAIRDEYRHAHHEIGGMLEVMDAEGVDVVPIMFAAATPGGIVADDAYEELLTGMLDGLKRAMPVDGCLVVPHGAAVSTSERDMDGHWLQQVRNVLGDDVPMVCTLDLHANISERMAKATNALVAYKQNPHLDQRERGKEATSLMIALLRGEIVPVQQLMKLPLAVSIEQQWTEEAPSKTVYALARELEQEEGVLSVSVALGFPYADVEEMGTSVLVVADRDALLATRIGKRMADRLIGMRHDFVGEKIDASQAMNMLPLCEKPVLLLDMGDNIGGGTPGNGLTLINALETAGTYRYFSYQPDAEAVKLASGIAVGQDFELTLQGFDERGDRPWVVPVRLLNRVDGRFTEDKPQHGGHARFDMGETLVVATPGGGTLMVSTLRIPPFSLQQLTAFGLDPASFDVLVAKGVNAPIAAYGPSCRSVLKVDTPGPSRADMTKLDFHHRRRPLFPFEELVP